MAISAFASLPHYRAHIAPILEALPERVRGPLVNRAVDVPVDGPVIVAGFADLVKVKGRRPVIYVEHGAGQTYSGDTPYATRHPSYSGSTHHAFNRVALFVCPSETVADRWRDVQPDTPAVAVGCPRLDRWHRQAPLPPRRDHPVIGWTWHWGADIQVKEATSALPFYERHLKAIVKGLRNADVSVIGHAHPRALERVGRMWEQVGARWTADPDDLFASCDLLVADNTSLLYEFASLDRPVVALNAPWYRRRVEHGLRFWSDVPGLQVNDPDDAVGTVLAALADPSDLAEARRATVARVYAHTDGTAAQRAADAIVAVL